MLRTHKYQASPRNIYSPRLDDRQIVVRLSTGAEVCPRHCLRLALGSIQPSVEWVTVVHFPVLKWARALELAIHRFHREDCERMELHLHPPHVTYDVVLH
jgi:hypothetical protein